MFSVVSKAVSAVKTAFRYSVDPYETREGDANVADKMEAPQAKKRKLEKQEMSGLESFLLDNNVLMTSLIKLQEEYTLKMKELLLQQSSSKYEHEKSDGNGLEEIVESAASGMEPASQETTSPRTDPSPNEGSDLKSILASIMEVQEGNKRKIEELAELKACLVAIEQKVSSFTDLKTRLEKISSQHKDAVERKLDDVQETLETNFKKLLPSYYTQPMRTTTWNSK